MQTLNTQDWRFLAKLWSDLADHHLHQVDAALEHMRERLRQERSMYQIFGVFSERQPIANDPLGGWRPALATHDSITPAPYLEVAQRWSQDVQGILEDEWLHIYMRESGTDRVMWRPDHVDRPWHKLNCGELMMETEVRDRIYTAIALSPTLELSLCFDAHQSQRDFQIEDLHFVQALMMGLRPIALRMALSHGLLGSQGRLSPRERQVLAWLLRGFSEKEIAAELGLSYKTLHQYVVAIYRKFNVHSRAELMALWLEPPRPPTR